VTDTGDRKPRVIRRYANRKLYDAAESRYVTLQDVEALVSRGIEVRVVDNRTGEDVTQTALAQILCDAGRRKDPRYSLGNILALFRRPELEERLRDFLRRRSDDKAKPAGAEAPGGESAATPAAKGSVDETERFWREVLAVLGRGVEDIQRRVDERVQNIVNDIVPLRRLNAEVRSLAERLAAVERSIAGRPSREGKGRGKKGKS
jgi:polyhydroxyalkanoate synthesis repressor PhaR